MTMQLFEQEIEIPVVENNGELLTHIQNACLRQLSPTEVPIRLVVTETSSSGYRCEFGVLRYPNRTPQKSIPSIFDLRRRATANGAVFNVALLVPTGVGLELGGHAGDAGAMARALAEVSDTLILHPNVVNASDLNEMPENSLYVEGSVLTRLFMGTIGLLPVRSNSVLVVIDSHEDEFFVNAAVNAVGGARSSYGLTCPEVVCLKPPVELFAKSTSAGRASGRVVGLEGLCNVLEARRGLYDAVAVSSVIDVPYDIHQGYFDAKGAMVNPWGGVEAMLTHALSSMYDIPTAHSPMFESRQVANMDPGIVDPRMAAEAVSTTFLQCTLKGLRRSPRIISDRNAWRRQEVLTVEDISCLVIPNGCLGLPTLAALEQGIPVIAVQENRNLMMNDLSRLPWRPSQYHQVKNYWEAIGVITAMRAGVDPSALRRPLADTVVSEFDAVNIVDQSPTEVKAKSSDAA